MSRILFAAMTVASVTATIAVGSAAFAVALIPTDIGGERQAAPSIGLPLTPGSLIVLSSTHTSPSVPGPAHSDPGRPTGFPHGPTHTTGPKPTPGVGVPVVVDPAPAGDASDEQAKKDKEDKDKEDKDKRDKEEKDKREKEAKDKKDKEEQEKKDKEADAEDDGKHEDD